MSRTYSAGPDDRRVANGFFREEDDEEDEDQEKDDEEENDGEGHSE